MKSLVRHQKKEHTGQGFVLFLIGLLLLSTAGFAFSNIANQALSQKVVEQGITFKQQGAYWLAEINGGTFAFLSLPSEAPVVDGKFAPLSSYQGKLMYYYSENNDAETLIVNNLQPVAQRVQRACYDVKAPCEADESLPLKSCDTDTIIIVLSAENASITQQGSCIFIRGNADALPHLVDSFFYKSLGVLP